MTGRSTSASQAEKCFVRAVASVKVTGDTKLRADHLAEKAKKAKQASFLAKYRAPSTA